MDTIHNLKYNYLQTSAAVKDNYHKLLDRAVKRGAYKASICMTNTAPQHYKQ